MPVFTGKSITLSIQEAYEDAVRQALLAKVEGTGESLTSVEVRRIYSDRTAQQGFSIVLVEIEAK